uniref:Cystic fibrosis transmembrane conductance regulator n=1 Tax=Phallusia mammillata TaxID=59560 RepID=A0A6F9D5B2_9ASCI|nr:multidrug resistance-associated protein 4 [Phallusia mammillata]
MAKYTTKDFRDNPLEKANIFSQILFWWLNDFFKNGQKRELKETDQFKLQKDDTSEDICKKLERNWEKELALHKAGGRKPSLFRAIVKTFVFRWFLFGFVVALEEVLIVITPLLLGGLLRYFENRSTLQEAFLYALGIFLTSSCISLLHHVYFYQLQRMGWHIRAGTCALMYKKTLRLSQKALASATTGQIVNLGATDVIRFDWVTLFLHFLWLTPVQAVVVCYLLWQDLGASSLAGPVIMVSIMVTQSCLGRGFGRIRAKMAVLTDQRIRTMNEVISAMRVIKMYTWEKPFENLIKEIRRKEISKVLVSSIMKACNFSMIFVATRLLVFVTFSLFVALGGNLTSSKVFTAIGLFNVLRVTIGIFFPNAIEKLSESLISMRRIQDFLLLDEFSTSVDASADNVEKSNASLEFNDFTASWTDKTHDEDLSMEHTLIDIQVKITSSKLFAVIGPVGAGKSSFLSAILRELKPTHGGLKVVGRVAYVGQVPWIFSGTIRENILFGEPYDKLRYKEVIKSCSLDKDIKSLEKGDETLVGERGVTLSGGQKARVNLARAAYRENIDIMLLDDPLSAVDSNVANHLFHECICGYMKDKIRVLVTHQLQFLSAADQIIILKHGSIDGQGTFGELQADGTDFAALLKTDEADEENKVASPTFLTPASSQYFLHGDDDVLANGVFDHALSSGIVDTTSVANNAEVVNSPARTLSVKSLHHKSITSLDLAEPLLDKDKAEFVASIEDEETRVQGSVGWKVYTEYLGTNKPLLFLLVILILSNHSLYLLCDWWISVWATQSDIFYSNFYTTITNGSLNTTQASGFSTTAVVTATSLLHLNSTYGAFPEVQFDDSYYIMISGILTLLFIIVMYSRSLLQFYYTVVSGIKMHDSMFYAVLRAPIRFFDVNPVGRILNRFSKDMGQIDEILPLALMDFIYISFTILSIMLLAISINFFVLIVVIPLLAYFVWLRQYYIKTSRDIKRMEGANRSPVFSHLSSTLQGLTTIRAFKMENNFEMEFHELQDLHSCSWFLFLTGSRWLAIRLDVLSSIFIGTVAFSSVLTASYLQTDAGKVGLVLSYSIMLMGMFQWGVRQSAEVENLMTSVERVQEYYRIPPEAPHEIPDQKPPADWPKYGIVTFDNLSYAHYAGGPNVLHKIRLSVRAHEKVGVVGRTGAGKSSLISTLFRLNEYSSGEVYIDGLAISTLGLTDLRSAISIIPQDPILFAGTLRKNLDPFSVYIDHSLWDALEQVQLKSLIESFPSKLECEVSEAGNNFSVGQRQLICLARAILRKNKILIVDEATANVDIRTDRLIQLTIRNTFQHCTVITVAHRINTVIDSDRVLVLENGRVVEFDEPHVLLSNTDGAFSKMVESIGKSEARELKDIARKVYDKTNSEGVSDDVDDADRSYLARFLPVPGSYDHLEVESNV